MGFRAAAPKLTMTSPGDTAHRSREILDIKSPVGGSSGLSDLAQQKMIASTLPLVLVFGATGRMAPDIVRGLLESGLFVRAYTLEFLSYGLTIVCSVGCFICKSVLLSFRVTRVTHRFRRS
jgi:hypothetical protein